MSLAKVKVVRKSRRQGENAVEQLARAINAEPWEPMPGMVRVRCRECRYFFAAHPPVLARPRCPDCCERDPRQSSRRHW